MEHQDQSIKAAIQELTSAIVDAKSKPHLRGTLQGAVQSMGFDEARVATALDDFFEAPRTLQ